MSTFSTRILPLLLLGTVILVAGGAVAYSVLASGKMSDGPVDLVYVPGFLSHDGAPVGPFGVMGGFMQPQGHVQVVMNTIDFGLNPQAALDAPRWEWERGKRVQIEPSTAAHLFHGLAGLGHDVAWSNNRQAFGRGQIIWRDAQGVLCGGTEPRADGAIAVW